MKDRAYGAAMRIGQPVAYEGPDDTVPDIHEGHPGRLIDVMAWMNEVTVSFVNGPSLCLPPSVISPISEQDYLQRGRRLVRLLHPLADRAITGFNMPGSEWPDGHEPLPGASSQGSESRADETP